MWGRICSISTWMTSRPGRRSFISIPGSSVSVSGSVSEPTISLCYAGTDSHTITQAFVSLYVLHQSERTTMIEQYIPALLMILTGIGFGLISAKAHEWLGPYRPNKQKSSTYESG